MKAILSLLLAAVVATLGVTPAKAEPVNFAEAAGELSTPSTTIKSGRCCVAANHGDEVLFDGPCSIAMGRSGAFSIEASPFTAIGNHAVFVAANASTPSAVINVIGGAIGLGSVTRDGDCWVNDMVKICVWEDGTKGEAWVYDEPDPSGGPYVDEGSAPFPYFKMYQGEVPRAPSDWVLDLLPPPPAVITHPSPPAWGQVLRGTPW